MHRLYTPARRPALSSQRAARLRAPAAAIDVPHPHRGSGLTFRTKRSFDAARAFVGAEGVRFASTTGDELTAVQAWSEDGHTPTIAFQAATGESSACLACWGYRRSCCGARIEEFAKALDRIIGAGGRAREGATRP